jgi:hypothetical protein
MLAPFSLRLWLILAVAAGALAACGRTELDSPSGEGATDARARPPDAAAADATDAGVDAADVATDATVDAADARAEAAHDPCAGACMFGGTCQRELLTAAETVAPGAVPGAIVADDFDRDGRLDLAFVAGPNSLGVKLGNGDGSFRATVNLGVSIRPYELVSGDLNGDGLPDLLTATNTVTDAFVLLGRGDGTFAAAAAWPWGPRRKRSRWAT